MPAREHVEDADARTAVSEAPCYFCMTCDANLLRARICGPLKNKICGRMFNTTRPAIYMRNDVHMEWES